MQFIEKGNIEPANWNLWFSTTVDGAPPVTSRKFDYNFSVNDKASACGALLSEQNNLCAYCQQYLLPNEASIEHIIPKSQSKAHSTHYHNLVAVCKRAFDEKTKMPYCEPARGSKLIAPLVFYIDAQVTSSSNHGFIIMNNDGFLAPKDRLESSIKSQVEAFIEILNLNTNELVRLRKNKFESIVMAITKSVDRQNAKLKIRDCILADKHYPLRQAMLSSLNKMLGIN